MSKALLGFVALLLPASGSALAADAMFRGNLAHTGVYFERAIAHAPKVQWTFHTKGPVMASPAIADGTVYIGSSDGRFYALDLASGAKKWEFKTGARVTSSAAVANGTVFFESFDGKFYALDAVSGGLKWKFAVPGERRFTAAHLHGMEPKGEAMPDPFDLFLSSPAVWNGVVYFGSGDGNVYALGAANGALKWKYRTGDVVHASPAIADGMLFIGSWDSWFYALDAATGALKWRFKTGEDPDIHNQQGIQSSAAVADGTVYFGCRDSNLYALDEKTGAKRWSFNNKGSWVIASPAMRDGIVYAATSDTGQFYALDGKTGAQLFALDFHHWPLFSSPALAGDFAYIGSHQGKLFAIGLKKRALGWEFQTAASKKSLPGFSNADGSVNYAAVQAGTFYDDMVVAVAKLQEVGQVLSSPVPAGNLLVFGATDGNVYALSAPPP
ncbi:MAG: PQQ-binding-like beta-propeller repeat protein [Alphaproteobacteria bacterium]|nr:PQQ-binding-like beta-propeller repeat protein [Alphaproteobacteria bacterium]